MGAEPGDPSSRILTLDPTPEHRPGPGGYCLRGGRHPGLCLCFFLLAKLLPLHLGSPTLPTNQPVTNTTHCITTLNRQLLLRATHSQSPGLLGWAGSVSSKDHGIHQSQSDNYNFKMSASYLPALFILIFVSCYMSYT